MTKQYNPLAYEQRCQISVLSKSGLSQRAIADAIGVSQSTVSTELARNTGERGYRHKQAQQKAAQRRKAAVKPTKMTPAMIETIESKLRIQWSPEQISGWLVEEREQRISHESIDLHIWADKQAGGALLYTPSPSGEEIRQAP